MCLCVEKAFCGTYSPTMVISSADTEHRSLQKFLLDDANSHTFDMKSSLSNNFLWCAKFVSKRGLCKLYVTRDVRYVKRDVRYVKRDPRYVKRGLLNSAYLPGREDFFAPCVRPKSNLVGGVTILHIHTRTLSLARSLFLSIALALALCVCMCVAPSLISRMQAHNTD